MEQKKGIKLTSEEHLIMIKHAVGEILTNYETQIQQNVANIWTELERQKCCLKKFIGNQFSFTNKHPNAYITELTFTFERASILHSDRTILVGAVTSNKEFNYTDSISVDLTTGAIKYRERKGKYIYDIAVNDESQSNWECFCKCLLTYLPICECL